MSGPQGAWLGRRIYGLETEFGLHAVGVRLNIEDAARRLFHPVVGWGRSSNVYLSNGGRLYLDVGAHPEYATPETDGLLDLLTHDRAGEELVGDLAVRATESLHSDPAHPDLPASAGLRVYKNNADSHHNSYGCHENFMVERHPHFHSFVTALVGHLVSRIAVCGAGRWQPERNGEAAHYQVSARADFLADAMSSSTTRSRPLVNTRDEPHADPRRFRRLHVISGDSTMSETTSLLKVGTTELVLRLIESGHPGPLSLTPENPSTAIRASSRDLTTPVPLADGGQLSALEMQQRLWQWSEAVVDSDELAVVRAEWGRVLDSLAADRWIDLADRIDWAIKRQLIERDSQRHPEGGSARAAQLALAYHQPGGIVRRMEESGMVPRLTDPGAVTVARTEPPATTRAALRGRFVKAARAAGVGHTVDWTTLRWTDEPGRTSAAASQTKRTVLLEDPLAAQDERVDDLIAAVQAHGGSAGQGELLV